MHKTKKRKSRDIVNNCHISVQKIYRSKQRIESQKICLKRSQESDKEINSVAPIRPNVSLKLEKGRTIVTKQKRLKTQI